MSIDMVYYVFADRCVNYGLTLSRPDSYIYTLKEIQGYRLHSYIQEF